MFQDTVVALQALALYSTLVYSPDGSSTVTVQSPSGELTFDVNQNNKLLYQEKILQDTTGKYSVEVKGNSCASIQVSHHYSRTCCFVAVMVKKQYILYQLTAMWELFCPSFLCFFLFSLLCFPQLSLHYNIPTPKASSVFNINVTTQSTCQANSGVTLKMESL